MGSSGLDNRDVVRIDALSFSYPDGHEALRGVGLAVREGETVGLIGPNGAGKSTLLLHLNGLIKSKNCINILGTLLNGKNLKEVRSKVGMVFQDPDDQLFMPTVFDDVAFGPINLGHEKAEVQRRVAQALAWVGMDGAEGRSSHHLSIGEKKRISIATVLSMSPEILVLDEPSASLDPRGKWAIIKLVRHLPMTKIVASHDMELIQALCRRTIVMDKGEIVADDLTGRILSDESLLREHGLAPCP
jgi:cobalt/nickel transport system ATP-binding protein